MRNFSNRARSSLSQRRYIAMGLLAVYCFSLCPEADSQADISCPGQSKTECRERHGGSSGQLANDLAISKPGESCPGAVKLHPCYLPEGVSDVCKDVCQKKECEKPGGRCKRKCKLTERPTYSATCNFQPVSTPVPGQTPTPWPTPQMDVPDKSGLPVPGAIVQVRWECECNCIQQTSENDRCYDPDVTSSVATDSSIDFE